MSSNDEEYLTPKSMVEKTPGQSDQAARILTTARILLNVPPDVPKNRGRVNPNIKDYHSNRMESSSTFWLPDITDWWCQQNQTHS